MLVSRGWELIIFVVMGRTSNCKMFVKSFVFYYVYFARFLESERYQASIPSL